MSCKYWKQFLIPLQLFFCLSEVHWLVHPTWRKTSAKVPWLTFTHTFTYGLETFPTWMHTYFHKAVNGCVRPHILAVFITCWSYVLPERSAAQLLGGGWGQCVFLPVCGAPKRVGLIDRSCSLSASHSLEASLKSEAGLRQREGVILTASTREKHVHLTVNALY